jgi:hypothetical protein
MSSDRRKTFTIEQAFSAEIGAETGRWNFVALARLLPESGREFSMSQSTAIHPDLVLARLLAACAHPRAAWRLAPRWKRCAIVLVYFGTGYVAVLTALLSASRLL